MCSRVEAILIKATDKVLLLFVFFSAFFKRPELTECDLGPREICLYLIWSLTKI